MSVFPEHYSSILPTTCFCYTLSYICCPTQAVLFLVIFCPFITLFSFLPLTTLETPMLELQTSHYLTDLCPLELRLFVAAKIFTFGWYFGLGPMKMNDLGINILNDSFLARPLGNHRADWFQVCCETPGCARWALRVTGTAWEQAVRMLTCTDM